MSNCYKSSCKHETEKEDKGWWGTIYGRYCNKLCQYLAGATCEDCPYKEEK